MSLNFSVQPGKIFTEGEKPTTAKLNQLGVPVIRAEGVIGPTDMGAGDYSATLGPGAYGYAPATRTGLNYTAAYDPLVTVYADGLWLAFKTDTASLAGATFDAGAGAKLLYAAAGTRPLETGELPANTLVQVRYNASLNVVATVAQGGWQIESTLPERPAPAFEGASAQLGGQPGLVPPPLAGQQSTVLRGNGRWEDLTADIDTRIAASTALTNLLPLYLTVNG